MAENWGKSQYHIKANTGNIGSASKLLAQNLSTHEAHFLLQVHDEGLPPTRATDEVQIKVDAVVEGQNIIHDVVLVVVQNTGSSFLSRQQSVHIILHKQLSSSVPEHWCAAAQESRRHACDGHEELSVFFVPPWNISEWESKIYVTL